MIGTAVGAVVGIGGSLIGGSSASKAAKTESKAAEAAAQAQLQAAQISANTALGIYGSTKASLQPFTNVGTSALNQLAMMYGLPVSNAPTGASQVPVIPGLNDGSGGQFGGTGTGTGAGGGMVNLGPFGSYPMNGGADPHAGMVSTAPSAQQQLDWIKANIGPSYGQAYPKIQQYLASHPGETPEQTIAGLQSAFDGAHHATNAYQTYLQGATTWAPPGGTPGAGTSGPPGNGQPTAPNFTAMLSALTQTPGYQFGLQQGQQALERSAASRGMTLSGAQLKDAQSFGTDYAIQAGWNPYVTQLNSFASLGQNAAAGAGNAGATAAGQVGSAITSGAANAGSARLAGAQATASGQLAQGKAWQDILGGIGSYF